MKRIVMLLTAFVFITSQFPAFAAPDDRQERPAFAGRPGVVRHANRNNDPVFTTTDGNSWQNARNTNSG